MYQTSFSRLRSFMLMSKLLWEMKCFKHSVWSIDFFILMVENVFHFVRFKKSWMKTKHWALILRKMTVSFCQITSCEKKIDFSSQKLAKCTLLAVCIFESARFLQDKFDHCMLAKTSGYPCLWVSNTQAAHF